MAELGLAPAPHYLTSEPGHFSTVLPSDDTAGNFLPNLMASSQWLGPSRFIWSLYHLEGPPQLKLLRQPASS